MRLFNYASTDLDADVARDIAKGDFVDNPKKGIMWDAHDAIVARHYGLEDKMGYSEWHYDDQPYPTMDNRRLWTALALLVVGLILVLGFAFLKKTTAPSSQGTAVQTYYYNGETYNCTFNDGDMSCVQVDDPDVGFGRVQP